MTTRTKTFLASTRTMATTKLGAFSHFTCSPRRLPDTQVWDRSRLGCPTTFENRQARLLRVTVTGPLPKPCSVRTLPIADADCGCNLVDMLFWLRLQELRATTTHSLCTTITFKNCKVYLSWIANWNRNCFGVTCVCRSFGLLGPTIGNT